MSVALSEAITSKRYYGIPIRNIWLLLLYASDLFGEVEKNPEKIEKERPMDELPDIVAEILLHFVRERLLRGLTRASQPQQAALTRVRGKIDLLRTERFMLLERGRIACRFHEPTLNTPRNRLIKAALEKGAIIVSRHATRQKCRDFATLMFRMGVTDGLPTREQLSREVYGINDLEDRKAVAAAQLLLDMFIPTTFTGTEALLSPKEEAKWLRRLFEKAIRGFYCVTASGRWDVMPGNKRQYWPVTECSEEVNALLPQMELDILLTNAERDEKIVIDTKYTRMISPGFRREKALKTPHMYQMYAYLNSQNEASWNTTAKGILLYPAVGDAQADLQFSMQGHTFVFATVNLDDTATEIRKELLKLVAIEEY